jgi:hypothetical protein
MASTDWRPVERLIDTLGNDGALMEDTVDEVRGAVPEIARLGPEDIARHTRALMAAAMRAIAERRGPSASELDFIEDLAVTRAQQGVPIHDVLTAIHVAQRNVWQRARAAADGHDVPPPLLLDARDLFEDWAEQVRSRLIVAHRRTELARTRSRRDRQGQLLRRLLAGGSAAALAAAEADLPEDRLWVVHAGAGADGDVALLEDRLRTGPSDLFAVIGEALEGVLADAPTDDPATAVGVAGPATADELDASSGRARRAHAAALATGRTGLVHVTDVALPVALRDAADLGRLLGRAHLAALDPAQRFDRDLAHTVRRHLELDRVVDATAADLFVHPNTVRHRLKRFTELTGLDLDGTFSGVEAWWAVTDWLEAAG